MLKRVKSLKKQIVLRESLIIALLVYFSIGTYPLNVISFVSVFLLVLFFRYNFFDEEPKNWLKISRIPLSFLIYVFGFLGSLAVVIIPSYPLHLSTESMWQTFTSLSPTAFVRIFSAYFIVCFFPGYVTYDLFLRRNSDSFGSVCLVPVLSYIMTNLITLAILTSGLEISPVSVICFIWVIVVLLIGIHYIKSKGKGTSVSKEKQFAVLDLNVALVTLIGVVIVLFSYIQVFGSIPFGGYLRYDVPGYMTGANEIMYFGPIVRAPYIWPQVFLWTTSLLTGLPMLYSYAGLQFYMAILPFSVYFLLYTLFKSRKSAALGTFLFFFVASTNALAPLWARIMVPEKFGNYLVGNAVQRWDFLYEFYQTKLGTSLTFSIMFSPSFMNDILFFLSIAFAYKYLTGDKGRINFLLTALFTAASLFSRNIEMFLIILITVIVYSLMCNSPKKFVVKIIGSIAIFVLFFDFLSRFYFVNDSIYRRILPPLLSYGGNVAEVLLNPVVAVPIFGLIFYIALIILNKHFFMKFGEIGSKILNMLKLRTVKLSLCLFSLFTVFLSIYLTLKDFANLSRWTGPWYSVVCTYFVAILPLAIGGFPYIKKTDKPFLFILSWITSLSIGIGISYISDEMLIANFPNRYTIALALPLICLAVLSMECIGPRSILLKLKLPARTHSLKIYPNRVIPVLLSIMIAISFLSFVYTHEFGLTDVNESRMLAQPSEIETYEWMNNHLEKGRTILPLSERSYSTLVSMVSDTRVLPIIRRYSPGLWFPYTWLKDILIDSVSPEAVLYTLNCLNVSYIYATEDDLAGLKEDSALKSLVSIFPIVFEKGIAKVYSVPSFPFFKDSNYVVVKSAIDEEPKNLLDVVNLLMASGLKFSVIPDLQLSVLKKDYVYFFPFSQHLPHDLLDNIINSVNDGAHVVFFDQSFASFDDLNKNYTVPPIKKFSGEVSIWNFDEGMGNKTYDALGDFQGIIHEATWVEGKYDAALAFDGSKSWVELPQNLLSSSDFLNGCLIDFWFKAGPQQNSRTIFSIEGAWLLYINPSGRLSFDIDGSSGQPSTVTANKYDDNTWHHVVASWDGEKSANVKLYVDGSEEGSSVQDLYDIDILNGTSAFGSKYDGSGSSFNGTLDSVRILKKSQVASLRIGNGSITFLDLSSLSKTFYNQTSEKQYLETVMGSLSSLLSEPNLPTSPICLPYPPDLFKYVIPEFISLWNLKGLHGYGLADQGLTLSGQLMIQSRNNHLIGREMMAENVTIFSNTTETTFQRIKLGDIRIMGDCVILSNSSEVIMGGNSFGPFMYLHMKPMEYNEIRFTNVNGEIILEKDNGLEHVALSGGNLTIFTINEYTILAEQPAITVNGFLDGSLLGAFSYENHFFATESRENITFEGIFVFEALYDSGQILFHIREMKQIDVKEK